jgi:hypothetical protein
MRKTTRDGQITHLPSFKVLMALLSAVVLLIGIPLLNQFILAPENRIDIGARELLIPFIPVVVAYFSPPSDKDATT